AQPHAGNPGNNQLQVPKVSSGPMGVPSFRLPSVPNLPAVTLYDQLNNPGTISTGSQDFETANNAFDDFTADDFVVPGGQTWNITEVDAQGVYFNGPGPAASFHVFFYANSGSLPGTLVYSAMNQPYVNSAGTFQVTLGAPAVLTPGTYWVSVQARQDFAPAGQWGWTDRTVQANNPAAWQNPGGGFGVGCLTWGVRTTCVGDPAAPDQMFRLIGTIGGATPTATPTATIGVTPTATPTCAAAWQNEPPMLNTRSFASGAVANNNFYVISGFNGTTYVTQTDFFNGSVWAAAAPIPTLHSQSKAAPVGNNIYVPGGFNSVSFGGPLNFMQIYNAVTNVWSSGMNMPDFRSGPAVAAFNGKVYIIGGFAPGFVPQSQVWEYDPVANTYATKTSMPSASGNVPGALLGNEIFVVGGSSPNTAAYAYNPTTDTWRTI